jgi:hypothetical protein
VQGWPFATPFGAAGPGPCLRGDADRTVRLGRQALTRVPAADPLKRFLTYWILARADWLRGDLGAAEHALASLVSTVRAAGEYFLTMTVCWELGQVRCASPPRVAIPAAVPRLAARGPSPDPARRSGDLQG